MEHSPTALEVEIAHLRGLDLAGLRACWRTRFGRRAPAHLPRHWLLRLLAYTIQADAWGDLDAATVRDLERIAGAEGRVGASVPVRRLRPGTLLMREWNGVVQEVRVGEDDFAWNGTTFASLFQVARAITGTRWNGPRFFGLRETPR